jgi:hypothetical protein
MHPPLSLLLLLSVAASSSPASDDVAAAGQRSTRGTVQWFSFYGLNASEQHSFATIGQTTHAAELAAAWEQYKMPGVLDVSLCLCHSAWLTRPVSLCRHAGCGRPAQG